MPRLNATEYLLLPWSIRGPTGVTDEHGNRHFEMRVDELPDFLVASASESEVLYEFKNALLAFLDSYTSSGEVPPHPQGVPADYLGYEIRRRVRAPVEQPSAVMTSGAVTAPPQLV